MKPSRFIYFEPLDRWDMGTILVFGMVSIMIFALPMCNNPYHPLTFHYGFSVPFLLYIINYKSLRKFNVWLIWYAFAILLHFTLPIPSKSSVAPNTMNHLWLMLSVFQVLRWISLKVQKKELVAPSRYGELDLWDGRKSNAWDFFFFMVYILVNFLFTFAL